MTQKKRILLADDEVIFLKATSIILRENGYICDCASDSKSVIEMLGSNEYDLLISDINMPGNSDMELISNISQIADGIPVILVTAYPSIENTIRALRFQVYDYLLKPVDFEELLKLVSKVLTNISICRDVTLEVQRSIRKWRLDLDTIENMLNKASKDASLRTLNSYLDISFKNIFDTLMRLRDMVKTVVMENDEQSIQNLHGSVKLREALVETVAILKKTKDTFKSKDLGVLRVKLESLLEAAS